MSMILVLQRISAAPQHESPRPPNNEDDVGPATLKIYNGEEPHEEESDSAKNFFQGALSAFGFRDDDRFDDDFEEVNDASLSLEKAWHGLHYLLSGDSWGGSGPRAFLLAGGVERGDDQGYGPNRYFAPGEVQDIAQEIQQMSFDDLWNQFDARKMTTEGIYPEIWDEPEDDLQEEYNDYFQELQQFLAAAALQKEAIVISMT